MNYKSSKSHLENIKTKVLPKQLTLQNTQNDTG